MPRTRTVLLVAMVAAIAGASASLFFEPRIAQRLAGTAAGQRLLDAALKAKADPPPAGVIVGERGGIVPDMRVRDLDGRAVALPDAWAGRTTLVNVWATWCAPCLKEMPELQAFAREQGANGTQVVGIALDDDTAVRAFLRAHAIGYPALVDTPGPADAGVRLGNPAGVLPYSVLVAADGRLLKTRIGPFRDAADIAAWAATN
ncbi:TlpA family protein disulfide reductase [Thermomonas sp.]|uniref:TlpA family protein disulfide reductase n=1 Tax=Thermomonas sp. TaxID=1971895 RepID=UPI0035B11035